MPKIRPGDLENAKKHCYELDQMLSKNYWNKLHFYAVKLLHLHSPKDAKAQKGAKIMLKSDMNIYLKRIELCYWGIRTICFRQISIITNV